MPNKRPYDQIEQDITLECTSLDSLSTEILLHLIVVSKLGIADVTTLASLSKKYRDALLPNKQYLRKRGCWTLNLIDDNNDTHQKVRLLDLPNGQFNCHPRAMLYKGDKHSEDLLIISYNLWSRSCYGQGTGVVLMAAYANTMNVKWAHRYTVPGTGGGLFQCILSPIGLIAVKRYTDQLVIFDPSTGQLVERYKDSTLPFVFGDYSKMDYWKGSLAVFYDGETARYHSLSLDTDGELLFATLDLPDKTTKIRFDETCKSDYIVFESYPQGVVMEKYIYIAKKPYTFGDHMVNIGFMNGSNKLCIHDDIVVFNKGAIVSTACLSKSIERHYTAITDTTNLQRSAFYAVAGRGTMIIARKRDTDKETLEWLDTNTKDRVDKDVPIEVLLASSYIEEETGYVWLWSAYDSTMCRVGPKDYENMGLVKAGRKADLLFVYDGIMHVVSCSF
jgi:hypothetical protein